MTQAHGGRITSCDRSLASRRVLEDSMSLRLVILLTFTLTDSKPTDTTTMYDRNKVACFKCPRGTRVSRHCTKSFARSNCTTCEPGTFQSQAVTQLEKCGQCDNACQDHNAIVVDECSPEHNLRCQCRDGYYNVHHGQGVMACVRHTVCPRGQVIVVKGDSQRDVTCEWCPTGHFYNASADRCNVCSVCGGYNHAVLNICTKTNDTVCGEHDVVVTPTAPSTGVPNVVIVVSAVVGLVVVAVSVAALCCYYCHKTRTRERSQSHERKKLLDLPDISAEIWAMDIFFYMKNKLRNWEDFLRCLPHGNREFEADVEMDRNTERRSDQKIYDILLIWYKACFNDVTIGNIVEALKKSNNTNLIDGVIKEYKTINISHESVKEDGASSAGENEAAIATGYQTPLALTQDRYEADGNSQTTDGACATVIAEHQTRVREIDSVDEDRTSTILSSPNRETGSRIDATSRNQTDHELTQVLLDLNERHQTRVKEI
ncbi:tumor necrosis factor receptor superfamily member 11B-like [Haliotis cracherodii]|uniref:tumor necrosis factor receptor superfamily member 11B-like n=1 Tax=Haliotis cracherodii TaxID=6455 RepID=UPI0039E991DD